MSALAKTFTVIVLVLSAVFLSMASALFMHATEWRKVAEELQRDYNALARSNLTEMKTLKGQIAGLNQFIEVKNREVDALRSSVAKLGEDLARVSGEKARKDQDLEKLLEQNGKIVGVVEGHKNRISELERDRDRLSNQLTKALGDKETAETQVARLTAYKTSLERDLADIRRDFSTAKQELEDKKLVLAQLQNQGVDIARLVQKVPPPYIPNATVVAVREDVKPALVLLSVGSNDKVEKGVEFTVYRGSQFVAKVVVEKVLRDMCGARVLFQKTPIKQGDSATTRVD